MSALRLYPSIAAFGVVILILFATGIGSRESAVQSPGGSDVPAISVGESAYESTTSVVNLLGQNYVSTALVYDGFSNGGNSSFPTLLAGNQTTRFWSSSQSVLELAPAGHVHSAGAAIFPAVVSTSEMLQMVGAASSTYSSGDGLEAYLFMTPVHPTSGSMPYYATDPEGLNGTFETPQGSVIFPYSTTPYIVVQWDPAFGDENTAYIYLVSPLSDGTVSPATIATVQARLTPSTPPSDASYISLNVSYNLTSRFLSFVISDHLTGVWMVVSDFDLGSVGFLPAYSTGSRSYFGVGGSSNSVNGWGLMSLNLSSPAATPAPPPLSASSSSSNSLSTLDVVLIVIAIAATSIAIGAVVWAQRRVAQTRTPTTRDSIPPPPPGA